MRVLARVMEYTLAHVGAERKPLAADLGARRKRKILGADKQGLCHLSQEEGWTPWIGALGAFCY